MNPVSVQMRTLEESQNNDNQTFTMKNILLILSITIFYYSTITAQYPTLLKDINTVGNSAPYGYCKVNNILYFSHDDEAHGYELWRTDGTDAGTYLVKDVNTGFIGSFVRNMVEFNGAVYFAAYTNGYGYELWKSDGTEAGTVLVKEINLGVDKSSDLKLLTNCGNYLLFTATNGINGNELWKSDGTTAGTTMLADITTGNFGSDITEIFYFPSLFSNNIYFTIQNSSTSKDGIWRTTFSCVFGCSTLSNPTKINNTEGSRDLNSFGLGNLIFRKNVKDLYKFDGTTVSAIKVGTGTTFPNNKARKLTVYNNNIYFTGYDATNGYELWKSDGTVAGTSLVKNINNTPTLANSSPYGFTLCNGVLYFTANDGINGNELWKTDGTTAGTTLVNDVVGGIINSNPANFRVNGNKLYFQTFPDDANFSQYQIHLLDATTSQLTLLKDFTPIPNPEISIDIELLNQTLIFTGFDANAGFEVWKSNGTVAGTSLVKDISQGSCFATGFFSMGTNTFFSAIDFPDYQYKLWKTDEITGITQIISNLNPFLNGSSFTSNFANLNGSLMISAKNNSASSDYELWKSDGTTAGTVLVKDISVGVNGSFPQNFCVGNNLLFFSASDDINGTELWKSDGTITGTVMIKDIYVGFNSSGPSNLVFLNGFVYFSAYSIANGQELWKSDGTTAGTTLVKDINVGTGDAFVENLVVFKNKLYFSANNFTNGQELWVSDGTTAGTQLVKDIYVGGNNSSPQYLTANNTTLYFSANNGTNGVELWKSDGTTAGTLIVKNISSDAYVKDSNPQNLTFLGNQLFFSASQILDLDGPINFGRELWRTDGTVENTVMVKDIRPLSTYAPDAISNQFTGKFPVVGSTLFFPANNAINGTELWGTNGIFNGTQMVVDLFQGIDDGLANESMYVNPSSGIVYFTGTNGQKGRETYSFKYCPATLNINTTVQTQNQKQQASSLLISSSNIDQTDYTLYDLKVQYQAGNAIDLQPGFFVTSLKNHPNSVPNPMTFFTAQIGGCN